MNGERLIEGFVDADLGDVSVVAADRAWSDAERDTVVRLAGRDSSAFLRAPGKTRASRSRLPRSARSCGSPRITAQIGKDCALD